ncbi:MAG: M23 family metallopeptidase [Lachnospiraceae bacterium]|nr:M23 family metallopeptidase [Lachnospiraceae bacterium]
MDIAYQEGTDVVASKGGTVIVAEASASEGNWVAII